MKLTSEGQAWLNETVQRIMGRFNLPEAERAGTHYELMSHLHGAAEQKAAEGGRSEVSVGDLQAVLLEMGGEEAIGKAFVEPKSTPVVRAGVVKRFGAWIVDSIILFVAFWAVMGVLWLAVALLLLPFGAGTGRFTPFDAFETLVDVPFGRTAPLAAAGFTLFVLTIIGYYGYFEGTSGQTFGKRVFDLRVVRVDGKPMGFREAIIRNVAKAFPPFPPILLILDTVFLVVFFSKEKQRVSDRMAETIVIETK